MNIEKLRRIYEYGNNKINEYYYEYSSFYDESDSDSEQDDGNINIRKNKVEETRKNDKKKGRLETKIRPHQRDNNKQTDIDDIEQVIDIFIINMDTDDIKCYRYIDTLPSQDGYSVDLVENKIVLCGGMFSGSSPVFMYSHNEIYHIDLDTMKCTQKKSQELKPCYDHLTTSRYNYIYKFGGVEHYTSSNIDKDILQYNIILDEWTNISQLNTLDIYKQIKSRKHIGNECYNIKFFSLSLHYDNLVLVGFNFITNRVELYYFNFSTSLWSFLPTNIPIISCLSIINPELELTAEKRYFSINIGDINITVHKDNIYLYFSEGNCVSKNDKNMFYTGVSRRYIINTNNFQIDDITSLPILYGKCLIDIDYVNDISFIQTHFPSIFNSDDYIKIYIPVLTCIFTNDSTPYIIDNNFYDIDIISLVL